jgi:hypothetical protein
MTPAAPPLRLPASRGVCSLLAAALAAAGLCCAQPARSATQSSLIVVPRPSSQVGLSYFKLAVRPGRAVRAGEIELRNLGVGSLRVALAAVNGQTLSTLGSGYSSPGSKAQQSTRWLHVGRRLVVLAARQRALVRVAVRVPRNAAPGDYLSGVSIEALGQNAHSARARGISIASVDRYVIGVEVSIAGPRHPQLLLTGAELERQPAGLTLLLLARNAGNVILQSTQGRALISDGRRTVAAIALGPGTFVTGTSIAYPIPMPREHPREGAVYRVRAELRYAARTATLDTLVRFGRAGALTQQAYGGPKAPAAGSSGPLIWLVALLGAPCALFALWFGHFLLYRRPRGARSALRTLETTLVASRKSGEPLSLITVTFPAGAAAAGDLVRILRSRLRQADRLCQLDGGGFLVVAADTDLETVEALAADLRRQLARVEGGAPGVTVGVCSADGEAGAAELLQRIGESEGDARVLTPSG